MSRVAQITRAAHALLLGGALALWAGPVAAYHQGETLKVNVGTFSIHGSYARKSCSAQANLRSAARQAVGFALYWRPGKSLHLAVTHPKNAAASGKQTMRLVFPDGSVLDYPMKRRGNQLQSSIGFGNKAQTLYKTLQRNNRLQIELPGVGDRVDVSLAERELVEGGLFYCQRWMHLE